MEIIYCNKGCCKIKKTKYIDNNTSKIRKINKKAGVFIFDKIQNKVLIVQSKGRLWGLPKGTLKYGETERMCAIRETKEETGIELTNDDFKKSVNIKKNAIYFYVEMNEIELTIQNNIIDNDVNSLGWIKPDCLNEFIINGHIILNQHCRFIFNKLLNISFSHSTFTLVKKNKK
jgi:ADP-ribose pyrophosphatase YjhB (NUDIX family)